MADKFGMMSQAYFKGKRELLEWISSFLEMEIPKVEVLASGAHYCQLLDALYPGSVKMSKVKFGAYQEEVFVQNWKLVQNAFQKHHIQKLIPVQRLIKARFQDNLEFLQWFHQYFNASWSGSREYNPVERRKRCKGAKRVKPGLRRTKSNNDNIKENITGTSKRKNSVTEKSKSEMAALTNKNEALEKELRRIAETAKMIESERDFYFQVLVKVETMCKKADPNNPDIKNIMDILYESNDDAGKGKDVNLIQEDALVDMPSAGEEGSDSHNMMCS